jgi:hypothetical protein
MKAWNRLELKIQLQDFVQVTQTPGIHFQFDHDSREGSGRPIATQSFTVSPVCTERKAAIQDVHTKQ